MMELKQPRPPLVYHHRDHGRSGEALYHQATVLFMTPLKPPMSPKLFPRTKNSGTKPVRLHLRGPLARRCCQRQLTEVDREAGCRKP